MAACSSRRPDPPRWSPNPELPRDENFNGGPNALLLKYDANHDGTLTKDELVAGLKAEFDARHRPYRLPDAKTRSPRSMPARIAADQSTATPLQDWNQDGCVDFREFSAAAYSLFDQLDRNGDGKITPQEFNPARRPAGRRPAAAGAAAAAGVAAAAAGQRRRPPPANSLLDLGGPRPTSAPFAPVTGRALAGA